MAGSDPPGYSSDPAEAWDEEPEYCEPEDAKVSHMPYYGDNARRDNFEAEYELVDQGETRMSVINSDEEAEQHLRSIAYLTGEVAKIRMHYEAELFRLENWRIRMLKPILDRKAWHNSILCGYAETYLSKTKRLVAGTLMLVRGRERVEIADPEAFCKRYESTELVRVKAEPDKKAVVEWMKQHQGITPDHADIVRQPEHWEVRV